MILNVWFEIDEGVFAYYHFQFKVVFASNLSSRYPERDDCQVPLAVVDRERGFVLYLRYEINDFEGFHTGPGCTREQYENENFI
jgi:hypothetical protein